MCKDHWKSSMKYIKTVFLCGIVIYLFCFKWLANFDMSDSILSFDLLTLNCDCHLCHLWIKVNVTRLKEMIRSWSLWKFSLLIAREMCREKCEKNIHNNDFRVKRVHYKFYLYPHCFSELYWSSKPWSKWKKHLLNPKEWTRTTGMN